MVAVGSRPRMKSQVIVLIVLAVALAFGFQGSRGLYETTEGRYAEAAREMIETGDWLVPTLDYEPHWSKPPLTYWALAGGMLLLGENEWGVRLAPAVAYLLVACAVFGLGSSMWDRRTALAAALVYATAPLAVLAATSVSTDPLLAAWEALAALAYWRALASRGARSPRSWIVLFWLFVGLGFLTKGPPALLTLLAVLVYHGWRKATGRPSPALASPTGLLVFAVVGLSWYVAVALREEGLLGRLLREEVIDRVASSRFRRNPEWHRALSVLVLPFVLGLGAWLGFVPRVLRAWRERIRGSPWWRELARSEALLFCAIWIAAPLLVLSFSKSRLPLYVLPFLPAPALILGRGIAAAGLARRLRSVPIAVAVSSAVVLLAVKGVAGRASVPSDIRPVYAHLRRVAGESPSVYAYELRHEYGLMFYLDGRMVRVSGGPGEPWAAIDRNRLVVSLADPGRTKPAFAVARRRAEDLGSAMDGAGLRYEADEVHGYTVFTIEPAPRAAGD